MKSKPLMAAFIVLSMLCLGISIAAASPKRVAILPLTNQTAFHDTALERELQQQITAQFHVPLNGVLQRVDLIPPAEINSALASRDLQQPNDWKELAAVLDADYIAGIIITTAYERRIDSIWALDPLLDSKLELALIGYAAASDQIIDIKQSAHYHSRETTFGSVRYLADEVTQKLFKKADFKNRLKQET